MNAGDYERTWIDNAIPDKDSHERKINWMGYVIRGEHSDNKLLVDWISYVPGSLAPCHLVVAAIQAMRNKGFAVEAAERYIEDGLIAAERKDFAKLQLVTAKIYTILNNAPLNNHSSYHKFQIYSTWEEISKNISFPEYLYDVNSVDFEKAIGAGWVGQLIGGALGTQIEGYTKENIEKIYGNNITHYLRKPETYNDDITYELVFLDSFKELGYKITSQDIADKWLEEIAEGYSAERIALENLRRGIRPPDSGQMLNYFSDWIGAQMRASIHGMVAPGNPRLAAKLAVFDGVISHSNSGLLGGMFNAILTSLAFVKIDMKELVKESVEYLPKDSEFYSVVRFAIDICESNSVWEDAWELAEKEYRYYNWIHVYPNIVAEIVALWFGNNEFRETTRIICACGLDVDCTAAPVLNILGISYGLDQIDPTLIEPLNNTVKTILRDRRIFTIDTLIEDTITATRSAFRNA